MLPSHRKNGLTSLFKEVRVFQGVSLKGRGVTGRGVTAPKSSERF